MCFKLSYYNVLYIEHMAELNTTKKTNDSLDKLSYIIHDQLSLSKLD